MLLVMRRTSSTARLGALFAAAILAGSFGAAHAGERSWSAETAAQFKAAGLSPAAGRSYVVSIKTRATTATSVVGVVRGSDPLLAREYVLVSADASSAEAVLAAARQVRAGARPKRSILFAVIAPQQEAAFAAHTPVPRDAIIASLSATAAPSEIASVAIAGADETSLGQTAHALATASQLPVARTVGTEALGFLEAGVPALSLVLGGETGAGSAYLTALARQVADNDAHPAFLRGSRFAPRAPQAQQLVVAPVEMPLGRRPQRNLGDYAMLDTIRLQ
jgi:hypothetical protein